MVHSMRLLLGVAVLGAAIAAHVRAEPIPAPSYTPPPPGEKQPAVRTDDAGWRGRRIVTRRPDVEIVLGGDLSGRRSARARVGDDVLKVIQAQDENLLIRLAGREGWLKKNDAVPLEEAVAYFSEKIKRDPESSYLYNKRGTIWSFREQYDKALDDFNTALRLDRYNVAAHTNQGMIWFYKGDYDKALASQNEALRLDARYMPAYSNRGVVWFVKKEYAKALADYDEALRLDPDHVNARNNRAWLFATCADPKYRDHDKAVAEARRACELCFWENAECLDTLAVALAQAGQFDEAVKLLKKVLDFPTEDLRRGQKERTRERLKRYEAGRP